MKEKLNAVKEELQFIEFSTHGSYETINGKDSDRNTAEAYEDDLTNIGKQVSRLIALLDEVIAMLDSGEASDGFHTFNELYEHRHTLFAAIVASHSKICWKSKKHDDGSMFDGWFIVGANIPTGCVTYHIPLRLWDLFKCEELENAPKWDGHTNDDVVKRFVAAINTIKG